MTDSMIPNNVCFKRGIKTVLSLALKFKPLDKKKNFFYPLKSMQTTQVLELIKMTGSVSQISLKARV
jgi:hypothetical protein